MASDDDFDKMFSEELGRVLEASELTRDEEHIARRILERVEAGKVQSSADMPALVATLVEEFGRDAPVESLLAKALDRYSVEEEWDNG